MKLPILTLTAMTAALLAASASAEDQPGGCKCEMMKKHEAAPNAEAQPAPAQPQPAEAKKCEMMKKPEMPAAQAKPTATSADQAELRSLLAEMNGNVGPKKLEAMAAIVTRLVEHANGKAAPAAPAAPADNEAPKAEAHHH